MILVCVYVLACRTAGVCASGLVNLMSCAACRERLLKEDVVWVLLKLAAGSEDSPSLGPGSAESPRALIGTPPAAPQVDTGIGHTHTRVACSRAVCSLSYTPAGCAGLLEHNPMPILAVAIAKGNKRTRRYLSIALVNLSGYKAHHATVYGGGRVMVCSLFKLWS